MKNNSALSVYIVLTVLIFGTIFLTKNVEAQTETGSWSGEYRYSNSLRGESGYSDTTEYTLTIGSKSRSNTSNSLSCHFVVQGPQLNNADYECKTEIKGDKLTFYFVKALETMSDGQVKQMQAGYVIGSLVKVTVRRKDRYRLEPGRYRFDMKSTLSRPIYFSKS